MKCPLKLLKLRNCVVAFVNNNFIEMQKGLLRIDKKNTANISVLTQYIRACGFERLSVLMYVACDGSLLKRLTLSFHSNAQFYLIRRDRRRKRRRAWDYIMTAFLCGENRCCEKSRSPFQLEIIHLATRVFLHFVLAKIRGWIKS